ncbi:hypothetical protein HF086_017323 [Spodoptera exigua]|uniref:Endonuclease/exonuclease/phosphatase domain-containing protein n=1 Tax=Spodoptera exigua TaxID=7107 RepID=A0A922M1C2_SPOEX|nr:hypothetical protein HF086_017323 [Spodoptera exigua]
MITKINICVLYLCKENQGFSFTEQLQNYLLKLNDTILDNPLDKFIILGDFNLSGIDWLPTGDYFYLPSNLSHNDEYLLVDEMQLNDLYQYNGVLNNYGRILDLVFSNDSVTVIGVDDPLVPIDPYHKAFSITINFVQLSFLPPKPRKKYLYNKGDYTSINKEISTVDWVTEFHKLTLEESVAFFYTTINNLRDKYIPTRSVNNDCYPVWYSASLRKVLKEKLKYFNKYKTYKRKSDAETFKLLRDRARRLEALCYKRYTESIEKSIASNPRHFWSYYKARSGCNNIPSSLRYSDKLLTSGESICNAFSEYFLSTFLDQSTDSSNSLPDCDSSEPQPSDIDRVDVTVSKVRGLLSALDPSFDSDITVRIYEYCQRFQSDPTNTFQTL